MEISISLTPQQASSGAIVTVPLPSGATRVRIPPVRDGDVVRIRVGESEVLLRIRVTSLANPSSPSRGAQWLGVLAAVAVLVVVVVLIRGSGGGDSDSAAPSVDSSGSPSYDPYSADPYSADPYTQDPYSADPYTQDPYSADPYTEDPYDTPTETPTPYSSGTCLNGTLPDSTTAQEVSGVEEVSCSASDAHYEVIETIPLTSDMSRCDSNSRTQYAFSYTYTLNGTPINEYVYCLIGLGSYAR
ncbi:LppU/SCO3897 family protein [Streptomyces sp. NBC_01236]|uniref:LppU/SCO3897 family protein n=1 Tax=Streptomyces sp. NBC_01236 TaxID=2903789 RepID=UPI002E1182DA|nr:hypothetical protein OG324_28435 [Streptomyces sp. NBC_01236]